MDASGDDPRMIRRHTGFAKGEIIIVKCSIKPEFEQLKIQNQIKNVNIKQG